MILLYTLQINIVQVLYMYSIYKDKYCILN